MSIFAELKQGITTHSPEETKELGRRLAKELPPDAVVALHGDLGVGKTVFVKGMATGFDVDDEVTSPTFNLFSIYEGTRRLVHLDAYRLDNSEQVEALMLDDFLLSPFCLAVEWPGKIADWLPEPRYDILLEIMPDHAHRIILKPG